jgi:hypothetical protein
MNWIQPEFMPASTSSSSLNTFWSNVSFEPSHTKRSTRFPSSGTLPFTFVSSPIELSVQYRYTQPLTRTLLSSAMLSSPRSEFEFTARSSTGSGRKTPSMTRRTCSLAFWLTRMSFSPMKAIPVGWLSPNVTVRTARSGSSTSGGPVWASAACGSTSAPRIASSVSRRLMRCALIFSSSSRE